MLVLTRKAGEAIMIDGGRIKVTVLGARNGIVRVGIEAPDDVAVNREEIHRRIQETENGKENAKGKAVSR